MDSSDVEPISGNALIGGIFTFYVDSACDPLRASSWEVSYETKLIAYVPSFGIPRLR